MDSTRWHTRNWLAIAGLPLMIVTTQPSAAQQTQQMMVRPATQEGTIWTHLPEDHTAIQVDGDIVYYCDGTYLLPLSDGYLVIPPPFDVVVPEPPSAAIAVVVGAQWFWYDRHAFYQRRSGTASCVTVRPPLGAVVPDPPENVTAIAEVGGVRYYMSAGSFYQPITDEGGHTVYVVSLP